MKIVKTGKIYLTLKIVEIGLVKGLTTLGVILTGSIMLLNSKGSFIGVLIPKEYLVGSIFYFLFPLFCLVILSTWFVEEERII